MGLTAEETLEGGEWSETLRWNYTWNSRNELLSATQYVDSMFNGRVEYKYSLLDAGDRKDRILYDSSNSIISWTRYENDDLMTYRVDEKYDSDLDGIDEGDPWREKEHRTYSQQEQCNLLSKTVSFFPSAHTATGVETKTFYFGYDHIGNVIFTAEDYCGGSRHAYTFFQDAFGNEVDVGSFSGDSWSTAADADNIHEHQSGKEYDRFTGLYYFHARWYDPSIGRYISRSRFPVNFEGPYAFCESNPLYYFDKDGNFIGFPNMGYEVGEFLYPCAEFGGNCAEGALDFISFGFYDDGLDLLSRSTGIVFRDDSVMDRNSTAFNTGWWGAACGTVAVSGYTYCYAGVPRTMVHYTTIEGAAGIAGSGMINASRWGMVGRGVYMTRIGRPFNLFVPPHSTIPIVLRTPDGTARIIPWLVYVRWGARGICYR